MAKMKIENRIKKEYLRIKALFSDLPENKKELLEKLLQNAAFMSVTLEDLQKKINEEGAIVTGKNGNGFDVVQEAPAQKSYNVMIGKYTATMKQLTDLLPEMVEEDDLKEFM